jgi:hypothetical protein
VFIKFCSGITVVVYPYPEKVDGAKPYPDEYELPNGIDVVVSVALI